MANVSTDLSQWPIAVHTTVGSVDAADTKVFIEGLEQCLRRRERYVSVFDSTKLAGYSMGDRDQIVRWMRENDALLRQYSIGTAVALRSAAMRFVISTVLLVITPASPIEVFSDLNAAMTWARARLRADALAG